MTPADDVLALYEQSLAKRGFVADASQRRAVERLQRLYEEWTEYKARRSNALKRLVVKPPLPKGVYLWGPVGRGKSFLMDSFYLCVPLVRKRRVHFHHFMREIHRELDELKGTEDPIAAVAERTAKRYRLICFDEFHVSDIADAMILGRLFEHLFARGVTLVATSNLPPERLYENGLQRANFLPFIELLKQRLEILELGGSHDYRMDRMRELDVYLTPLGAWANAKLDEAFRALSGGADGEPRVLRTQGRDVEIPRAAPGVAMADFLDWCAKPMGAADFICICSSDMWASSSAWVRNGTRSSSSLAPTVT